MYFRPFNSNILTCFIAVHKAVANANSVIAPALINSGLDINDQDQIDQMLLKLDGSENKSNLGANAILSCSMACVKASAEVKVLRVYSKYFSDRYREFLFTKELPSCLEIIHQSFQFHFSM